MFCLHSKQNFVSCSIPTCQKESNYLQTEIEHAIYLQTEALFVFILSSIK